MLDLGGREEDITYSKALNKCLLKTPSKKDVGTGGSQQQLNEDFWFDQVCVNILPNKKPYISEQTTFNRY